MSNPWKTHKEFASVSHEMRVAISGLYLDTFHSVCDPGEFVFGAYNNIGRGGFNTGYYAKRSGIQIEFPWPGLRGRFISELERMNYTEEIEEDWPL